MLPYGLRITWFSLSLAGLVSSLFSFPALVRTFAGKWIPLVYCIANLVMQVLFCLGLIWTMDPTRMPRGFCIVQTSLIQVSAACLAGLMTSAAFLTTAPTRGSRNRILYKLTFGLFYRILLVGVYPAIILAAQLALLLTVDSGNITDGMSCDESQPAWLRLVGYGGTSLIFAIPSFLASIFVLYRSLRFPTFSHNTPVTPAPVFADNQTTVARPPDTYTLPSYRERKQRQIKRADSLSFISSISSLPPPEERHKNPFKLPKNFFPQDELRMMRAQSLAKHSKFHLPFYPAKPADAIPSSRRASLLTDSRRGSKVQSINLSMRSGAIGIGGEVGSKRGSYQSAPSPMIFATPSRTESKPGSDNTSKDSLGENEQKTTEHRPLSVHPELTFSLDDNLNDTDADAVSESLRWAHPDSVPASRRGSARNSMSKDGIGHFVADDSGVAGLEYDVDVIYSPRTEEGHTQDGESVNMGWPWQIPRVRRFDMADPPWDEINSPSAASSSHTILLLFTFLTSLTQILASITPLVDVLSPGHDSPMSFGTQHVALILVAWTPCLLLLVDISTHRRLRICS